MKRFKTLFIPIMAFWNEELNIKLPSLQCPAKFDQVVGQICVYFGITET